MIKIAFCDDDLTILQEISRLLGRYRVEKNKEMQYTAFQSAIELLSGIERGVHYDILILDILMPGENGIAAAKGIRAFDSDVKIIFLTSSTEFAVQSYTVNAFFYQIKPIWEEGFFRLMDSVLAECVTEQTDSLILKCTNGITRVNLKKLEYCEVIGRTLYIHLYHGDQLESKGRLDDLSAKLMQRGGFLRPHRSYLINMDYIQNITYRGIILLSQYEIPIPRGKYSEMKNAFFDYVFQSKQVIL